MPPDKNIQICERILTSHHQRGSISDALKEVGRILGDFFFWRMIKFFKRSHGGGTPFVEQETPSTEKIEVYDPVLDYRTGKTNASYILVTATTPPQLYANMKNRNVSIRVSRCKQ